MKRFVQLFSDLDASTSTTAKVAALVEYFNSTAYEDAAWAVYFLVGGKPKRTVPTRTLKHAALDVSGLPLWLFEESYLAVGDLAETIALVLPPPLVVGLESKGLAWWLEHRILPLRNMDDTQRLQAVLDCWRYATPSERFMFVKLVGGGFRVGVSRLLVTRALAVCAGVDSKVIATRLMGYAEATHLPTAARFEALLAPQLLEQTTVGHPFPFFLAHPLQAEVESLGPVTDWLVEWKFDGIRAQIVKEQGSVWIWSRGEELISNQFPELLEACAAWPDGTTLDGEILVWRSNQAYPAGFKDLQTRLNRKVVSKKLQADYPVVFLAYDVLRHSSIPTVDRVLFERRALLEQFFRHHVSKYLALSEQVLSSTWAQLEILREESRDRGVEGFMLKHRQSRYGVGRTKVDGVWWKWKIEPMTIDCVLVYAQRGHGRRANLYTDYTFAVWDSPVVSAEQAALVVQAIAQGETIEESRAKGLPCLVPFAKAYSGLTDEEFLHVDRAIKKTTVNQFGPVRTVTPSMVFELGFEAIAASNRHKSGVAVRFPAC
jgi:DNA ligase-1